MESRDLRRLLDDAEQLPYGPARVAALEAVRDRADAEAPDSLLPFAARFELVYSAIKNGERTKSFVAFSWCLAAFDREPERYGGFAHRMMWAFKWQVEGLMEHPEVPLERTRAVADDMERRYRAGGHGLHAVLHKRLSTALHLGDADGAADLWRTWEITPADGLSDCAGCVPSTQVAYLVAVGRFEEAVRRAEPVLQGRWTCHEQPQWILTHLLPAYVATGRLPEAADAYRKAYQAMRTERADLEGVGLLLEFLSRTGNEHTALAVVEAHLPWLDQSPSPGHAMTFAAFAALGLGRLDPSTPVRAEGRPTAGDLAGVLAGRAREIAARFDARNGSRVVSERVEGWITAEPWVEELPLNDVARRRRQVRRRPAPEPRPVERVTVPQDATVDELLDLVDERLRVQDADGAAEALAAVEHRADPVSDLLAARVTDSRARLLAPHDPAGAVELWRGVLPAIVEDETLSRRVRGRMGQALSVLGQSDEAVLVGEEPLRWLVEHDEPVRRSGWAATLALVLLNAGRGVEALTFTQRALEGEDVRPLVRRLHGEALWAAGKTDEAVAAFRTAAEESGREGAEEEAVLRWRLAALLGETGDTAGVVDELVDVVALLDSVEAHSTAARFELAWAYLRDDRPAEAAELAEDLARLLDGPDAGVEHLLAGCYETLDEPELALTHLRAHAELVQAHDPAPGHRGEIAAREGQLLAALGRHHDALTAFRAADAAFAEDGDALNRLPVLRRGAGAAVRAGLDADAGALRDLAASLTDDLEPEARAFHLGGLAWDVAREHADAGRTDAAIERLHVAEARYRELGIPDRLADCLLLRADLGGTVDPDDVRPLFEAAVERTEYWYRLGYVLADVLPEDGAEVKELTARLEAPE